MDAIILIRMHRCIVSTVPLGVMLKNFAFIQIAVDFNFESCMNHLDL